MIIAAKTIKKNTPSMIVCIAEKQSQAQNIAQVLGQLIIIHESLRN